MTTTAMHTDTRLIRQQVDYLEHCTRWYLRKLNKKSNRQLYVYFCRPWQMADFERNYEDLLDDEACDLIVEPQMNYVGGECVVIFYSPCDTVAKARAIFGNVETKTAGRISMTTDPIARLRQCFLPE